MIVAPASNIPPQLYAKGGAKDTDDDDVANLDQPKVYNHDEHRNDDVGVRVEAKGVDTGVGDVGEEAFTLKGGAGIALPGGGGLKALRALRK